MLSFYLIQIYPGAVELMQVIEDFIHIVGLGMKDFHNAYLMTGNLGKNQPTFLSIPQPLSLFYFLFLLGMDAWSLCASDSLCQPPPHH